MSEFANDVKKGLSHATKRLPSKYLYDDEGSRIFREIMDMPEYYLTDCEYEILSKQAEDIIDLLDFQQAFNLIEMGAGDGKKTMQLIAALKRNKTDFTYVPIDISKEANEVLINKVTKVFPDISTDPKTGDYFQILKESNFHNKPGLILFIGSNIGNYNQDEAASLLKLLHHTMKKNDKLLIGVDLKKDPFLIRKAYDDPAGITRRFNLNLLKRINRELGGTFDLDKFDFYSTYDPISGEVKSFHISLEEQEIFIKKLNQSFAFSRGEAIWTELSKKYDLPEIKQLLETSGFQIIRHFTDKRSFFSDTLAVK